MKFTSIILVIVSVLSLSSCQKKDPILNQISEMIEQSESTVDLLDNFKTKEIYKQEKTAKKYLEIMSPYVEKMEQDILQKYSTLANTVKLIKKQPFNKEKLSKEIDFNTTQLKALYTAQKNKTMSPEDVQKNLKKEQKALEQTSIKIRTLKSTYKHIYSNFNLFLPNAKAFIDSIKQVE